MGKKKGRTLGAKVGDLHKKQLLIQQKPSPFDNASKYTGHKRAYPPSERGPEAFIAGSGPWLLVEGDLFV